MNVFQRLLWRPFFIRLFHWEYWSFGAVYAPIYPIWIWLALRARSFFFFAAANPKIKNGGFLCESKKDIHAIMADHLYPKTVHFDSGTDAQTVQHVLKEKNFTYPLIGKPDSGGRGRGVKILHDDKDCAEYAEKATLDFHIQEYVSYKNEVGIFYYRYPDQKRGKLSGIVRKEFLSVTGDGKKTIRQLILENKRALLQMDDLQKTYGDQLNTVLSPNDRKVLLPYGNHARGAMFLDDSYLIDEQLTSVMNDICSQLQDFYYGRLDIRYNTWEELRQGKNYSVIEVNGAGSEPTHMYDPKHSLFFAWKEIVRHWFILNRISRMNHKRGYKYLTVKEGLDMFRENKEHAAKLLLMKA